MENIDLLFTATQINWLRMKRGFDDLLRQRPADPWLLNRYASFACQKNERAIYLAIRKKIGKSLMEDDWAGSATPEYCDEKLGYRG